MHEERFTRDAQQRLRRFGSRRPESCGKAAGQDGDGPVRQHHFSWGCHWMRIFVPSGSNRKRASSNPLSRIA